MSERLSTSEPLMLIRLSGRWRPGREEMEPGYFRAGGGWFDGIDAVALRDSARGWWRLNPLVVESRGISHAAALKAGTTISLYSIDEFIGPRADGRWAMRFTEVTSGPLFDEVIGADGKRVAFHRAAVSPIIYWPRN